MWKLQTFRWYSGINKHDLYVIFCINFKIVSNFTRLTAREFVAFMPNITTKLCYYPYKFIRRDEREQTRQRCLSCLHRRKKIKLKCLTLRLLTHYQHIFNSTYSYLKQTGAKMIPVMYNYAERQNDDKRQRTTFNTYPRADPYSKADSRRPVVYRKNTSRTKCDH